MNNAASKIIIAGAGPAGSSLAIRLAQNDFHVTLIEREKFPRRKLCGEFISPECLNHFEELGVRGSMLSNGGERIARTRFFDPAGRFVEVPSDWLGTGEPALSLSRAEMDFRLLERARSVGVEVMEEARVTGFVRPDSVIRGVEAKTVSGETLEFSGDIFIDATGRTRVLSRLLEKRDSAGKSRGPGRDLVGFKAHFSNAALARDVCEIYSFPDGYGGLSPIENGLANFCFLIRSEIVQQYKGHAGRILKNMVFRNSRAAEALRDADPVHDWLAVAVDGFGTKTLTPAANVFSAGDSAAFIDPFTGSGMLMALESSKLLARLMADERDPAKLAVKYAAEFRRRFATRLFICSLLRRAAYSPAVARSLIALLGLNSPIRRLLARTTRGRLRSEPPA